ncbi:MAG: transcription-repair coupling factor [Clostridia bacterium]|nr:transcription-repair coupling factor [Clostridia bacterium]
MNILKKSIMEETEFSRLLTAIDAGGCPAVLTGVSGIHRAHAASAVFAALCRPVIVVSAEEAEAKRMASDLSALTGESVPVLLTREFTFYDAEGVSRQAEHRRISALYGMKNGGAPIVSCTVDGLLQRTLPPECLAETAFVIENGRRYPIEEVTERLFKAGYRRTEQVEGTGQFALRGGILDFFSPAHAAPVRCEFFGDDIDSMGFFDTATQRRTEMTGSAVILPAAETLPNLYPGGEEALADDLGVLLKRISHRKTAKEALVDGISRDIARLRERRSFSAADKYMEVVYDMATAADYIPADAIVMLSDTARLSERAKNYIWQQNEDITALLEAGVMEGSLAKFSDTWEDMTQKLSDFAVIMADSFTSGRYPLKPRTISVLTTKQLPSYGGSLETAAGDISHYIKTKYRTVVLCQDRRRAETLRDYLNDRDVTCSVDFAPEKLPEKGECMISLGALSAGMEYPDTRLAVITEGQFMPAFFRKKAKKPVSGRRQLESFTDLSPGDLIVHETYGIGRFVGIYKMPVDKIEKDYIKIAYSGSDSLYIPATQLDMISKYIGGGEDKPVKLSKMGGSDWVKAKTRAKGAAKQLAKGLLELQAQRKREAGYAFSPDSTWQTEFEEAFEYQETDDQLRAVREIKADMERPAPMDRLLCGDVGYGKTEVALRAVMKCVLDGKQAAILVPTTVLAQQHFMTATKRFSGYPVKIEILSRFRTPSQMKKAVADIAGGSVDIVIGTHKLLQKDMKFKDLGLLVVDEEQRFGVTHKERLKELSRQVDVLTLSATPIPRTLNMALSGIRDMSTIEEPPQDRQPVQTYVMEHDWGVVCDAIRRELSRGGQVYYIHNRVENIDRTASHLTEMLEDVSVAVAHGQMEEDALSDVMEQMSTGEVQVLVCTTIIETGIDIPNVNTLIIEDADRLGLAQLHQIRGRVGRSSRRAFAYLTFRQGKVLTEIAEKRLSAIREFAEFNSGFKIAMRDLEIRGAGNILGPEQSGHMMSVGYDMYLKLLEEAVMEEKGEKPPVRTECSADLSVAAFIPESYVPSGEQRMDLYRRIAHIRSEDDADDLTDELIDRFGEPPKSVNALIHVALLRGEAASAGVSEIAQKSGSLRFTLSDFRMESVSALYERPEYKNILKIEVGNVPAVSLKLHPGKSVIEEAVRFVRAYSGNTGIASGNKV